MSSAYQSLPEHNQLSQCYFSGLDWLGSFVTSVTVWTPSSVLTALLFSGCLTAKFSHISHSAWTPSTLLTALLFSGCMDYKLSHINRCLETIKCTYKADLQWMYGLQV
ncbi:hypothetical protein TNIN_388431 [Trichonephila inaurata madagascariensis]|uniref:Uncharacterized protein n=1 Tax=Trichonephila inaurata madagascariensis TaxID=2747483 RepID=A0A8X7CEF1_9ARAC|nr:hypothetical protein TNIN_388431 [Trichonephila inaurata madagascariensis]